MKSYHVMKSKELKIVKEVIPCDVSPVPKFSFDRLQNMSSFHGQMQPKLIIGWDRAALATYSVIDARGTSAH